MKNLPPQYVQYKEIGQYKNNSNRLVRRLMAYL